LGQGFVKLGQQAQILLRRKHPAGLDLAQISLNAPMGLTQEFLGKIRHGLSGEM
jgi:hypothetical protein